MSFITGNSCEQKLGRSDQKFVETWEGNVALTIVKERKKEERLDERISDHGAV